MLLILLLGIFVALGPSASANSVVEQWKTGPNPADCDTMLPAGAPTGTGSKYVIKHNMCQGYQSGASYEVKIGGPVVQGFYCRTQREGTIEKAEAVGQWEGYPDKYSRGDACPPLNQGRAHVDYRYSTRFPNFTLHWQAPREDVGKLQITCTVVGNDNLFYGPLRSDAISYNPATQTVQCGAPSASKPSVVPAAPESSPRSRRSTSSCSCQPGQQGPRGAQGLQGPPGPRGVGNAEQVAHLEDMVRRMMARFQSWNKPF